MKTLRFFLCVSMTIVVLFCACDKSDRPLDLNSLTVSNHVFSGCVDIDDLTKADKHPYLPHTITLEASGNTLKILRQGRFPCGSKAEIVVTNEGNTITIEEVNKGPAAMCSCPSEYKSEINGMKVGTYTICVFPFKSEDGYYKPFVFNFKEGVKEKVKLEFFYN